MLATGISERRIFHASMRYRVPANQIHRHTAWAQDLGYKGKRPLVVRDGHIINHGHVEWLDFCRDLRERSAAQH